MFQDTDSVLNFVEVEVLVNTKFNAEGLGDTIGIIENQISSVNQAIKQTVNVALLRNKPGQIGALSQ